MTSPLKDEETLRDFYFKQNKAYLFDHQKELDTTNILIFLLVSTRFNDISDLLRVSRSEEVHNTNLHCIFENNSFSQNFVFNSPIIKSFGYFLEIYLNNYKNIENYPIIQKILNSLLLNKKKYRSSDYFIKKLFLKNNRLKKNSIFLTIMNHENLFSRKIFNEIQNYFDWFCSSIEKFFTYNYYKGKISFSLGKIALKENKKIKSFSLFIEAIEEFSRNNFKNKIITIEWAIFSSVLLEKNYQKNKLFDETVSFNSKNLLKIKAIRNSLERSNMILLEKLLYETNRQPIFYSTFYLLIKKFFRKMNKKIRFIFSVYIRFSIHHLAIQLGISREKVELALSHNTLKGKQQGYFDCINDTYNISIENKQKTELKKFLDISIYLGSLVGLSLNRKKNFLYREI